MTKLLLAASLFLMSCADTTKYDRLELDRNDAACTRRAEYVCKFSHLSPKHTYACFEYWLQQYCGNMPSPKKAGAPSPLSTDITPIPEYLQEDAHPLGRRDDLP